MSALHIRHYVRPKCSITPVDTDVSASRDQVYVYPLQAVIGLVSPSGTAGHILVTEM